MSDIANIMDEKGRINAWPSKKKVQSDILVYISSKFENGRFFTEKEVNLLIDEWHTFGDYFLLRRGLTENRLLSRTKSGSRYWKEERDDRGDIAALIEDNYDTGDVKSIFLISNGYIGSRCYFAATDKGEYIFKDIERNPMNHPENEALILAELKENDIPVPEIYTAKSGDHVLRSKEGTYHLQKYIEGKIYDRNTAPEWLLFESASMLGKIQKAMESIPTLPTGIGQGFFDNMTPQKAQSKCRLTLELAAQKDDTEIIGALDRKIKMLDAFRGLKFDVSRMTCRNTHGDYKIHQIICGKDKINAIIDFTSACVHPVCWELIRSYSFCDRACAEGNINIDNFIIYLSCYLEHGDLNAYDLKIMPYVYFYQILVSDYFGQYYHSNNRNRDILRVEALFLDKLCKWFEENITKLEDALTAGF